MAKSSQKGDCLDCQNSIGIVPTSPYPRLRNADLEKRNAESGSATAHYALF